MILDCYDNDVFFSEVSHFGLEFYAHGHHHHHHHITIKQFTDWMGINEMRRSELN